MRRAPRKGKTKTQWQGPEGKEFVELVEDIRYANWDATGRPMPWELVRRELWKQGYCIHECPDKLKADYHTALKHWLAVFGGRKEG